MPHHPDYIDTVAKTTQSTRPAMRVPSTGGVGVQAVDTPMVHTRRTSNPSTARAQTTAPVADIPPTSARRRTIPTVHPAVETPSSSLGGPSTEGGQGSGESLLPNWEIRATPDGKKCERAKGLSRRRCFCALRVEICTHCVDEMYRESRW